MPKPKKFLNDPSSAVDEFVAGLLLQYPNHLRKLAGHHVVLHGSFDCGADEHPNLSRVSLLSGGGSGHEPAHAGYIGDNMLSGAILGGIFVSLEVLGPQGLSLFERSPAGVKNLFIHSCGIY